MFGRIVFTDSGDCFDANSPDLSDHYRTARSGPDFVKFLMRNIGCVLLELKRGHAAVRLDSESVSPVALTALLIWLHEKPEIPIALTLDDQSVPKLFKSRSQTRDAIGSLIEKAQKPEPYVYNVVPLASSVFANSWRVTREILQADVALRLRHRMLNAMFNGYYALSERDSSNDFVATEVGKAVRAQFSRIGTGQSFRDMYDKTYGGWLADTLRVVRPGETCAHLVSAPIRWPADRHPVRHSYSRLLVGYTNNGRDCLLTATIAH